jgi:putative Mg2+ transporter-C (MgtC) family protein
MKNYQLSPLETVARLALAAVMGSVIGWERQRKEGAAGLRTHMMVCLGSALVMIVSAFGFEDILGRPDVVLDPSRIAAQVISGIGFLGAGTIVFLRPQVIRGLTTAAGLWTVAAIGLAVGGGLYLAAIATTVIALLILAVIKPLEHRMMERRKKRLGTGMPLPPSNTGTVGTAGASGTPGSTATPGSAPLPDIPGSEDQAIIDPDTDEEP